MNAFLEQSPCMLHIAGRLSSDCMGAPPAKTITSACWTDKTRQDKTDIGIAWVPTWPEGPVGSLEAPAQHTSQQSAAHPLAR